MAGQIIKKGERKWLVRIFRGRDESGKRRYISKLIHGTKKAAQDYLNNTLTAISTGTFIEPSPLTLNAYLDKWLETAAKPRLRERSCEDYKEYLKRYVRDTIGTKRLSDIRPLDIQNLYSGMQTEKGLSARTIRYCHAILSSAFKQAVKWQMLIRNPCDAVDLPRQQRKEMNALTPDEAKAFLDASKSEKWYVIFELALTTGMRPEEYLALQWKDLNFEVETLTVRRALVWKRKGGGWTLQEPKTPQSRRTIPLPSSVLQSLREHRRKQNEERMKAGPDYQNNDFIFAGEFGNPILASNLYRRHFQPVIKKLIEESKLTKKIRLYDLRHTCATLLLAAGENPKVVSERLGHASITLTLDVYSHVLPSMQKSASDKLESLLFSKTSTR
jgi:integrase